jgi:predicted metalloendopeptidase
VVGASDTKKPELGSWGVDLTARNTDIKPGNDFYHYANGHWLDTFEIPADLSGYGSFTMLSLHGEEQIKDIIEEQPRATGSIETVGQKIAEIYSGYMDQSALDAKGLKPLDPYLKKIAAAKSLDDIAVLMGDLTRMNSGQGGSNTPFAAYIDQDEKIPSQIATTT